jgi:hypothetical protein
MNRNVFQCHGEQNSKQQFLKTVGVLEEHINKTFDYPQDVASICKVFAVPPLLMPPPSSTRKPTKKTWHKR